MWIIRSPLLPAFYISSFFLGTVIALTVDSILPLRNHYFEIPYSNQRHKSLLMSTSSLVIKIRDRFNFWLKRSHQHLNCILMKYLLKVGVVYMYIYSPEKNKNDYTWNCAVFLPPHFSI